LCENEKVIDFMQTDMKLEKIHISKLLPADYNPRKDLKPGDNEYEKLKNSINEFGYVEPVIWNTFTGRVVGGHQRLKVLCSEGKEFIDCVVISLPEDKEKALNIALNKISGDWDNEKLALLMQELQDKEIDLTSTGFNWDEINKLFAEQFPSDVKDDEFDLEEELESIDEPITKPGDVWLLGRHKLLCGDATNIKDVLNLMDGSKANLCVTDPPYNVDYEGATEDKLKIMNDKMSDSDFYEFLLKTYKNLFEVLDDGAAAYIFHSDTEGHNFRRAFKEAGFHLANVCIWVKNSMVLGRSDYQWQHEPILYGWKATGAHKWYSDRKQTTIWNFDKPFRNAYHPTMKPVELCAYPIQNSSMSNCIVLDLFAGSGSTLVACEQTQRTCYSLELDPKYCDVIVKRFKAINTADEVFLIREGCKTSYNDVTL
jgi:DNA modification methylase